MANGKSPAQLEQIAKNLCHEKGVDYGQAMQAFEQFRSKMNIK
jgi:hypothetical protein